MLVVVAACAASGPAKPALNGETFALDWGPIVVHPGIEDTRCVMLRLPNVDAIKIHQLHNTLGPTSHHMIIYRDDADTEEVTSPTPCTPFAGALDSSGKVSPILITQKRDDVMELPPGVAYSLGPNQMFRLEMHFINAGDSDAMAFATTEFFAADPSTVQNDANLLFIGTRDIVLPPNQMTTVEEVFTPSRAGLDLAGSKIFAFTGHTHKLGIDEQITVMSSAGDKTPVYVPHPFAWSEPETVFQTPELSLPDGTGLDFQCSWNNTTANTVKYGESANDEMCFFWAYYYPAKGTHFCLHSKQLNDLDICCPDAGPALCNLF